MGASDGDTRRPERRSRDTLWCVIWWRTFMSLPRWASTALVYAALLHVLPALAWVLGAPWWAVVLLIGVSGRIIWRELRRLARAGQMGPGPEDDWDRANTP